VPIEARVVLEYRSPDSRTAIFSPADVAANDGLLDPEVLGKIVGARDMLLTSEE
jgi:hypothetical protein